MEDKQKICDLLLATLQNTRDGANIKELRFGMDMVAIIYQNGRINYANVEGDSGVAMICDILMKL